MESKHPGLMHATTETLRTHNIALRQQVEEARKRVRMLREYLRAEQLMIATNVEECQRMEAELEKRRTREQRDTFREREEKKKKESKKKRARGEAACECYRIAPELRYADMCDFCAQRTGFDRSKAFQ